MKIDKPGIYRDFPVADYFADPCPAASLTQSIAKVILERSPLHAWYAHSKLNPDWEPDDDTKFDIGNIAHTLLIGRGKNIIVLDHDDWRTKEAKAGREAARQNGQLAVLGKHYAKADKMVRAAREQLELRGLASLFNDGAGEVVIAWREKFWCRQMIDWLTENCSLYADYKTTDMSASPYVLGRRIADWGWDIQGAMCERGLQQTGRLEGPHRCLFIVQETQPPYCLSVAELSESVMTIGRKKLDAAMTVWGRCLRDDRWPGYPQQVVVPEYPGWAEAEWLNREEIEFSKPDNVLMGG